MIDSHDDNDLYLIKVHIKCMAKPRGSLPTCADL